MRLSIPGGSNIVNKKNTDLTWSVLTDDLHEMSHVIQFYSNIITDVGAFLQTSRNLYTGLTAINLNFNIETFFQETERQQKWTRKTPEPAKYTHWEEINDAKMQLKCQSNCDELNLCCVRLVKERAMEHVLKLGRKSMKC